VLHAPPQDGDCVWLVKVSKARRLYVQRVPVLVAARWRITLACSGRRLTWAPDTVNLFETRADALEAVKQYMRRVVRRRATIARSHQQPAQAA
jgi:hypothetical protein